jgi:alpha-tubulin suppressor-like RCC1 family protein
MKTKRNLIQTGLLCAVLLQALTSGAQPVVKISHSYGNFALYVKSDGSLWGNGVNLDGELGDGTFDSPKPFELIVPSGVTAVATRTASSFFLKADGSLWGMGRNGLGQLGDGTYNDTNRPVLIVPSGVTAVDAGQVATIFLKDDGSLWGFGWNHNGELGDGAENNMVTRPEKIVASGVVAIAAGQGHSLFIKNDGSLWGMGANDLGQLGLGTNINRSLRPTLIVASNVTAVAAGEDHSLFIKSDGSLWAMGLNSFGQLGDCTIDWAYRPEQIVASNVVGMVCGEEGSMFLKQDGSLWAMGYAMGYDLHNEYGEGISFGSHCPEQIVAANKSALIAGYYYNAALKTCASIWAKSFNNHNQTGVAEATVGAQLSVVNLPGYNRITIELLEDGNVRLTYRGNAGANYALDRSSSLTTPNWVPQVTNYAGNGGVLVITNTPDLTTNNFWRIRSVP